MTSASVSFLFKNKRASKDTQSLKIDGNSSSRKKSERILQSSMVTDIRSDVNEKRGTKNCFNWPRKTFFFCLSENCDNYFFFFWIFCTFLSLTWGSRQSLFYAFEYLWLCVKLTPQVTAVWTLISFKLWNYTLIFKTEKNTRNSLKRGWHAWISYSITKISDEIIAWLFSDFKQKFLQ